MSYIPITIQVQDPETEEWSDKWHLHATKINKSTNSQNGETNAAGAEQYHPRLVFEIRYFNALAEAVRYNPQQHRIVYQGHNFDIVDYDDFMERHKVIRLVGVAYG